MRSIGLIGSLAALALGAPLAAQSNKFRTDNPGFPTSPGTQVRQSRTTDRIPPGQMPPAGMCRIWIDGVPPGRQPAPTDCQTAVANKPANAQVIWGSRTANRGSGFRTGQNANGIGSNANVNRGRDRDDSGTADDDGDDNQNRLSGNRGLTNQAQWPTTTGNQLSTSGSGRSRRSAGNGRKKKNRGND